MPSLTRSLALILLGLVLVIWLGKVGDPPKMLVSACAEKSLPNPCDRIDCNRPNTQVLT